MKIKYFGYYIKDKISGNNAKLDISKILDNFTAINDTKYKSSFKNEGENLYLFKSELSGVYIFVESRNTEFFKKINTERITLSDLSALIDSNEEIGHASYIIIKDGLIGICSTYMAPSISTFVFFINDIIQSLGIVNFNIKVEPLLQSTKVKDVMNMTIIGRTSIELTRDSDMVKDIANIFGADLTNDLTLGSVEIIFKPARNANIKPIASEILKKTGNEKNSSLKVRAKNMVKDTLSDFYLGENGHLFYEFSYKLESEIPYEMQKNIQNNLLAEKKLEELMKNVKIQNIDTSIIDKYNNINAWNNLLANISSNTTTKVRPST